jgi:hypothetical protein
VQVDFLPYVERLAGEVQLENAKHRRGIVHAVNFDSVARDGKKDAADAAADFKDGDARSARQIEIKRQINSFQLGRVGRVVMFGGYVVGIC